MQVVITDCDHGNVDPERQVLEPAGIGVELAQTADPDEIARIAAGARALIVQYAPIGPEVMDRCPDLRVIARYGVGVDTIDIPAASARNIAVCNVTGYCTDEVADQALALMMATLRKVALHDRRIRAGNWDFRLGGPIRRIRGQTLGILGCGRIGEALGQRARALGMRIIAHDPYRDSWPDWIEPTGLDGLLARSDVVSLHLGLSDQTRNLLDRQALAAMKRGAVLINTSRGGLVDGHALAEALASGHLSGAGLDVFEPEPIPSDHPILQCPGAVLSPHLGFYSEESLAQLKRQAAEAVLAVLRNAPGWTALNADQLPTN